MELELNRIDYCSVGATLPNCMKLIPAPRYKEQQRMVVGDQDGIVQLFSMKKEEMVIHFKTLPADKVQSIQLSGTPGTIPDKIFVATDNKVKAFNKKGKIFLTFTSNLTEPIKTMFVSGNDMILCGNHVYNHYRDCKDIGSYLCGDTIVDVVALCPNNTNRIVTVLACSGRVLRVLEHCRVRQSIELESVPTVLHIPKGYNDRLICGMTDGRVVLFRVGNFVSNFKEETLVEPSENSSAVTTIDAFDLTGDGKVELIVGRRDGSIQVYSLPSEENAFDLSVRQIYNENFNESISTVQGGTIDANGYVEVVVCTYTGRIFGLSTRCPKKILSDSMMNQGFAGDSNARIEKLKEEIRDLEMKVQRERERYKLSTQTLSGGYSAIPMMPINSALSLSKEDASYSLTIEIPAPIEFVLLQSNAPVQLIDVEKSSAVVSFSRCDPSAGNYLLATYRCQVDVNRLDLKFRTIEGYQGILQAFITPNIQPKVSQLQEHPIKPLSLHMRIHSFDNERPHNKLTLKGYFSHAEAHTWISNCIPEVPEKLQIISNERSVLNFRNVFIGSELMCEYTKGEATFKTENVTTISIIKDILTKEATKRRTKLEILLDVNRASVSFMIGLIEPKLIEHSKIHKEYQIIGSLIDLDIQDNSELESLGNDFADVLERKNKIIETYNRSSHMLDRIKAIIICIYIDYNKLRGSEVKHKVHLLDDLIKNYNNETLVNFILGVTSEDHFQI
ncbi:Bardet-Biedl syndrome 7 protein homolog [Sitodiplosis mosellana]|uniref:Bardet-Biedl syndrome 7 protein homolog n=1 Tax=Sitodiplosis mosellana TaxID=263140 RepID=UPI00244465A8|nr:Bardet-Biedl syndrome 7 protein homolog [Sitodiplosis mosellana]